VDREGTHRIVLPGNPHRAIGAIPIGKPCIASPHIFAAQKVAE
jgi:hypothetical protein